MLVFGRSSKCFPRSLSVFYGCCFSSSTSNSSNNNHTSSSTTNFGFRQVNENDKEQLVADVFHRVANTYDVMNDFMSGGIHRLWKDHFVHSLNPQMNMSILDVAGGTGDIAFRVLRLMREHQLGCKYKMMGVHSEKAPANEPSVVVCDINASMLKVGEERAIERGLLSSLRFVEGNAEELPFENNSFDAYTIAFGLRNVTHPDRALREAYRVLRPGGRLMILEFSRVNNSVVQSLYDAYSFNVIPWLGEQVANDRHSYQYLVESIRKFATQEELVEMMHDASFSNVTFENLCMGVSAIHSGFKLEK